MRTLDTDLVLVVPIALACLLLSPLARAEVIVFPEDKEGWEAAVGEFTTIDFTGFPEFTWITDQYAHLGAHFVDGADLIQESDLLYLEDGWGIDGNTEVRIEFDEPISYIGFDFPGIMYVFLYSNDEVIYTTPFGGGGPGHFGGLISDEPFDAVRFWDGPGGNVNIDDIHFGPPIPAPGALMLLSLGTLLAARRRRRHAV
jgi:hypothetical protein